MRILLLQFLPKPNPATSGHRLTRVPGTRISLPVEIRMHLCSRAHAFVHDLGELLEAFHDHVVAALPTDVIVHAAKAYGTTAPNHRPVNIQGSRVFTSAPFARTQKVPKSAKRPGQPS